MGKEIFRDSPRCEIVGKWLLQRTKVKFIFADKGNVVSSTEKE